jgi:hypothetical protein
MSESRSFKKIRHQHNLAVAGHDRVAPYPPHELESRTKGSLYWAQVESFPPRRKPSQSITEISRHIGCASAVWTLVGTIHSLLLSWYRNVTCLCQPHALNGGGHTTAARLDTSRMGQGIALGVAA